MADGHDSERAPNADPSGLDWCFRNGVSWTIMPTEVHESFGRSGFDADRHRVVHLGCEQGNPPAVVRRDGRADWSGGYVSIGGLISYEGPRRPFPCNLVIESPEEALAIAESLMAAAEELRAASHDRDASQQAADRASFMRDGKLGSMEAGGFWTLQKSIGTTMAGAHLAGASRSIRAFADRLEEGFHAAPEQLALAGSVDADVSDDGSVGGETDRRLDDLGSALGLTRMAAGLLAKAEDLIVRVFPT